ncbi:MAG: glycine cleavage system protein H [Planctomycetota bacterium]
MMGEYEAHFPTDRMYAKNHMWASSIADGFRFGLSAYAVRLLQDVYFLDMDIEPGMQVVEKKEIGAIESKKAESSLYCPTKGSVAAINDSLLDDPTAINLDKYGEGWMFELRCDDSDLLSPEAYVKHLRRAWNVAQATIKGQANA